MSNGAPTMAAVRNRMRQLDEGRRFNDISAGGSTSEVDGMWLGEAKRFKLAIMHVDMNNFRGITRDMENIDKLRLLNIYLSEFSALVRDYGGFIEKYVGDGISALFGAGKDGTGAVLDAVECAMTMRAETEHAMGDYLREVGLPKFTCSVGMDYGNIWVARVGVKGANQLTLVGNEVSLAKNLEVIAKDGQILVGDCFYSKLCEKYRGYCRRLPQREDFNWKADNMPYPYYEYAGRWVVRDE